MFMTGWKADRDEHIVETEVASAVYRADRFGATPLSFPKDFFDLRRYSAILDQYRSSACVGFTVAGAAHCRLRAVGFNPESFSPVAPYSMGRKLDVGPNGALIDDGSIPFLVMTGAKRFGLPTYKAWPYDRYDTSRLDMEVPFHVYQQASQFRLSNFARITATGDARVVAVMQALFAMHPVPLGMQVGDEFQNYKKGRGPVGIETVNTGGHMTYLVGWEDYGEVFIGNTSWGLDYGDEGFFRIHKSKLIHPSTTDIYNFGLTDMRA